MGTPEVMPGFNRTDLFSVNLVEAEGEDMFFNSRTKRTAGKRG
jgi:hypothetical protein